MFICAFKAALFIFAEFNHMIKIKAFITLCDATVSFKQFAYAFLIQVQHVYIQQSIHHHFDHDFYNK